MLMIHNDIAHLICITYQLLLCIIVVFRQNGFKKKIDILYVRFWKILVRVLYLDDYIYGTLLPGTLLKGTVKRDGSC
jgi:hypothetical protein